jgi:hypothetical protein
MNRCSAPGARSELLWRRTVLCERQIENAAALLPSAHFRRLRAVRSGEMDEQPFHSESFSVKQLAIMAPAQRFATQYKIGGRITFAEDRRQICSGASCVKPRQNTQDDIKRLKSHPTMFGCKLDKSNAANAHSNV